jgi:DMSO/TMAO reductase YedYZ molybdopterin-dependent catalytic subunit
VRVPSTLKKLWATPLVFALSAPSIFFGQQASPSTENDAAAVELRVTGSVSAPLALSMANLKKMPRKTLKVVNPHEKNAEVYEGVPIQELLRRAGVPQGDGLRGAAMASYVLAEAADGYRVVFSLAELDSDLVDAEVIVADTLDGAPLGPKQGPFKIVAPHEKRPSRWVRMLRSLTVVRVRTEHTAP